MGLLDWIDDRVRDVSDLFTSVYDKGTSFSHFLANSFGVPDWVMNPSDSLFSSLNYFYPEGNNPSFVTDAISSLSNSPVAVQEGVDTVASAIKDSALNGTNESPSALLSDDASDYFKFLFETSEEAARHQAQRNELAAYQAYQRSEEAADNALRRARELRQTQFQDAVSSLKAAGLNPVLAASGGLGGFSTTAPQANAPASSSSAANGINGADLLSAIAQILSASGNLLKGLNPTEIVKNFFYK